MRKTHANKDAILCIFGKQDIPAMYLGRGGGPRLVPEGQAGITLGRKKRW